MNAGRAIHLRGLNGLRALAALTVVLSHLGMYLGAFGLPAQPRLQLADFCVTVFFALSGFLITYLLLLEQQHAPIDVRKFYVRRMLRIWPLYYLCLAVVVVQVWIKAPGSLPGPLVYYVLLLPNLVGLSGQGLPTLGHYWSLGVEEQFYLFWPWLLRSARHPLRVISCFALGWIAVRLICHAVPAWSGAYHYLALARFDCMAVGGIGAILFLEHRPSFAKVVSRGWVQAAAWGVLGLIALRRFHVPGVSHDVVAGATVCIIVAQIQGTHRRLSLDHPVAEFLGKISYGIYVWHLLVIQICGGLLRDLDISAAPKYVLAYVSVFGVTLLVAYASHRWLELPFLRWKEKYGAVLSLNQAAA